ncbi:MAG: hypothetical protein GXY57_02550 [Erysipelotrichaceae bacterium]|nr:hypothetical protein [Sphaerochaetaceae bacterium]NLV29024.1 hypothetical protein [Erysipelotrichaceae bacterium]
MKKIVAFTVALILITYSLAATQLSVPLGHRVYDVLKAAELRGYIAPLPNVTPFNQAYVVTLLHEIKTQSNKLSHTEIDEINELLSEFNVQETPTQSVSDVLHRGHVRYIDKDKKFNTAFGIYGEFTFTGGTVDENFLFDSRNKARVFFSSDITQSVSVHMNLGLMFDKLDNRLFNATDFTIPAEGFYESYFDPGLDVTIPMDSFLLSFMMNPELSVSLFDNRFSLRWASIKRDWGVGFNNFQLSSSAREFNAIDGSMAFTDWLHFSFIIGSLGKFSLAVDDTTKKMWIGEGTDRRIFFTDPFHENHFSNNYSAHRVELRLPGNLTFSIYEALVWQKRFEIGYLNPFTVYMLEQNISSDYDEMIAGFDIQWHVKGKLRAYGAISTSEMNEITPSLFFKHPRNILAMQAGIDLALPIGSFSSMTAQYTYLGPFFYTHQPVKNINGNGKIEQIVSYVNKGENLGYPLDPNSDEILLHASIGLPEGWRIQTTGKYQRRSGQYGYAIDMYMDYSAAEDGKYELKDFTNNLIEKKISVEIGAEKTMETFPLKISGSYRFGWNTKRLHVSDETHTDDTGTAIIKSTFSDAWSAPSITHAVTLQISIYR